MRRVLILLASTAVLAACQTPGPYEPGPSPAPRAPEPERRQPTPAPEPEPPAPTPPPPPARPPAPQKQYRLSAATAALVSQARTQSSAGDHAAAAATVERALRIEPSNPLLWIELGKIRQAEGNYAQADAMGRRALSLAAGDPPTQAAAWNLIAESLRARRRNQEAAEAEQRAKDLLGG